MKTITRISPEFSELSLWLDTQSFDIWSIPPRLQVLPLTQKYQTEQKDFDSKMPDRRLRVYSAQVTSLQLNQVTLQPEFNLRVMAIKKIHTRCPVFQRPLNCRVVCGAPFLKNIWVPIFSKNLPDTGSMYHTFFPPRSPTFCHILRVPGRVRHPSFVFIRQRVQAPGRSPCIIIRQRVRGPGRSRIDHPTFISGHRLVPYLQI